MGGRGARARGASRQLSYRVKGMTSSGRQTKLWIIWRCRGALLWLYVPTRHDHSMNNSQKGPQSTARFEKTAGLRYSWSWNKVCIIQADSGFIHFWFGFWNSDKYEGKLIRDEDDDPRCCTLLENRNLSSRRSQAVNPRLEQTGILDLDVLCQADTGYFERTVKKIGQQ